MRGHVVTEKLRSVRSHRGQFGFVSLVSASPGQSNTDHARNDTSPAGSLIDSVMSAYTGFHSGSLQAPQRSSAKQNTGLRLQPVRCFKTGASDNQANSNAQNSAAPRRCVALRGCSIARTSNGDQHVRHTHTRCCRTCAVIILCLAHSGCIAGKNGRKAAHFAVC